MTRIGRVARALLGVAILLLVLGLLLRFAGLLPLEKSEAEAGAAAAYVPVAPPPRHAAGNPVAIRGPTPPPDETLPDWRRYAAVAPPDTGQPRVVIVIDDLGLDRVAVRRLAAIPGPLTLSFLPYAPALAEQTAVARAAGHELLVHLPMEPKGVASDPGPMVLASALSAAEFDRRLEWNLDRFPGFVGVNNHMGSRLTENRAAMRRVMQVLRQRGLLFLDSRTTPRTVAEAEAAAAGVPHAARQIFLDNEQDARAVRTQLAKLERMARRRGLAIAIGHPHRETIDALGEWIPAVRRAGIAIAPLSAAVIAPATAPLTATAAAGRR
ncbi:MAG: divergent polysaccharide deacetylase family protein [Rhodothalassiaceae bacterium]